MWVGEANILIILSYNHHPLSGLHIRGATGPWPESQLVAMLSVAAEYSMLSQVQAGTSSPKVCQFFFCHRHVRRESSTHTHCCRL